HSGAVDARVYAVVDVHGPAAAAVHGFGQVTRPHHRAPRVELEEALPPEVVMALRTTGRVGAATHEQAVTILNRLLHRLGVAVGNWVGARLDLLVVVVGLAPLLGHLTHRAAGLPFPPDEGRNAAALEGARLELLGRAVHRGILEHLHLHLAPDAEVHDVADQ